MNDGERESETVGASPRARVFISYSRKDGEHAARVCAALEARGIGTWMDTEDVSPGAAWLGEIETGARGADTALILIGRVPLGPWQQAELDVLIVLERERRLGLVPVLLPGARLELEELPLLLRRFQVLDLRGGFSEEAFDDLAKGIGGRALPITKRRRFPRWPLVATGFALASSLGWGALRKLAIRKTAAVADNGDAASGQTPDAREIDAGSLTFARPDAGKREDATTVSGSPSNTTVKRTSSTNVASPPAYQAAIALGTFAYDGHTADVRGFAQLLPQSLAGALTGTSCPVVAARSKPRARYLVRGTLVEIGTMVRVHAELLDRKDNALVASVDFPVVTPYFMAGEQKLTNELRAALAKTTCKGL